MTQEEKDRNARALSLRTDKTFVDAVEYLKAAATKELLNAKTPEEREDRWRDYHSFKRVADLIAKWAAEASTTKN